MLTCSIILALYNGETYIEDQLQSIYAQTVQPQEVLILDDGSNDSSLVKINDFINNHRLQEHWKVIQNETNLGVFNNFVHGVEMAGNPVVFFCDQDDVWDMHKIEKMLEVMTEQEDIKVLSSSEKLLDQKGNVKDSFYYHLFRRKGERLVKVPFSVQIRNCQGAGHTLAVRRDFFLQALPFMKEYQLTYDIGLTVYAAALNYYAILSDILVYRRMHDNNTSKPHETFATRLRDYAFIIKSKQVRLQLMEAAFCMPGLVAEQNRDTLKRAIDIYREHIHNLQQKKGLHLIRDVFLRNPMIHPVTIAFDVAVYLCSARKYTYKPDKEEQI